MVSYLDKILYIYPNIQGVVYWYEQYDGTPWPDPYDGIVWNNETIAKPSKKELDALDDDKVQEVLLYRENQRNLTQQVQDAKADPSVLAAYYVYKQSNPSATLTNFISYLLDNPPVT